MHCKAPGSGMKERRSPLLNCDRNLPIAITDKLTVRSAPMKRRILLATKQVADPLLQFGVVLDREADLLIALYI
ncbi:hypothetical protein KR51_00018870 [Rubidibacter lacunae KORDI 51-2]|uniref:Uncharacterized protein n=1 Tax=Rubidibacter lacunae KORDI 51-2 TaxID=582515 RepID=U5DIN1_9CHRO|nr:hypothetical protein KR51_00018870 [Rubidibacter lacunae KORDI 51-2]